MTWREGYDLLGAAHQYAIEDTDFTPGCVQPSCAQFHLCTGEWTRDIPISHCGGCMPLTAQQDVWERPVNSVKEGTA